MHVRSWLLRFLEMKGLAYLAKTPAGEGFLGFLRLSCVTFSL